MPSLTADDLSHSHIVRRGNGSAIVALLYSISLASICDT